MELRPVQTALLAGRAASRWATSTSTTAPKPSFSMSLYATNFSRFFSSTTPSRQEAEATVPFGGGLSHYMAQQKQQQRQQQAQQQESTASTSSNDIFAPEPPATSTGLQQPWQAKKASSSKIIPTTPDELLLEWGMGRFGPNPTMEDINQTRKEMLWEKPENRKLRLRPVVGRTIDFGKIRNPQNRDLARGLAMLNMSCKINRVNQDSKRQRFHERPGLKRKRQKSERWQKRFREGFQATCVRVSELARQGW
ncbi:unnamed protein product [Discula destructiva]